MKLVNYIKSFTITVTLGIPFLLGISCNDAIDCRKEQTSINSPFCDYSLTIILWIVLIIWISIFIFVFYKKKWLPLWSMVVPSVIFMIVTLMIFLNHRGLL